MAKRRRREGKQRRLLSAEQIAQAPRVTTACVLGVGLVTQFFISAPCDQPCADPRGGGPATLPSGFDIDTVPTRIDHVPVVGGSIPVASGGTITSH